MSFYFQSYTTIVSLLIGVMIAAFKLRAMDTASKVIFVLLCTALITECGANYAAVRYGNNMPVYDVFSILEIGIVGVYFNYSIENFRRRHVGYFLGLTGMLAGTINSIWFEPLNGTNSAFMITQGFMVIALCMYSLIQSLENNDYMELRSNPHFWFALIFMFFWSLTLINWLVHDHLHLWAGSNIWVIDYSVFLISLLTNIFFALEFFFHRQSARND